MASLFPFLTEGGAVSWMAVLGFILAVFAALLLVSKVPPLKRLAGI